jgi:protein-tyrosine phosphatase
MAAVVFREHLRRTGLSAQVRVTSAGIGPWHVGEHADPRARATLHEHGYGRHSDDHMDAHSDAHSDEHIDGHIDGHIAAQVDEDHLSADLLLAADAGHLRALQHKVGDTERVRLLRDFDPAAGPGAGLPDPYYGGDEGFDEALAMIEAAMPGLLAWVRGRL